MIKVNDDYLKNLLAGKKVVVTGSSKSVMLNEPNFIDSFDLVVRINHQWPITVDKEILGERMDLLYHCCSGVESVQKLFTDDFNPKWVGFGDGAITESHILENYLKGRGDIRYERIYEVQKRWRSEIGSLPQTGFLAVLHLLEFDIAELYMTGLTFMLEPYMPEYPETRFGNDQMIWTRNTRHHDCAAQFYYFCQNIYEKDKRLKIDNTLKKMIDSQ
jgi:hypothetical protein